MGKLVHMFGFNFEQLPSSRWKTVQSHVNLRSDSLLSRIGCGCDSIPLQITVKIDNKVTLRQNFVKSRSLVIGKPLIENF